jgi:hypothetical protein
MFRLDGGNPGSAVFEGLLFECHDEPPVRIDQFHPKLIPTSLEAVIVAIELQNLVCEISTDGLRRGDLRHGAMEAAMPGSVLAGMTGAASGRADVFGFLGLRKPLAKLSAGELGSLDVATPTETAGHEEEGCTEEDTVESFTPTTPAD